MAAIAPHIFLFHYNDITNLSAAGLQMSYSVDKIATHSQTVTPQTVRWLIRLASDRLGTFADRGVDE